MKKENQYTCENCSFIITDNSIIQCCNCGYYIRGTTYVKEEKWKTLVK